MEEKAAFGIVFVLLLVGMLTWVIGIQTVRGMFSTTETIYIRADGRVDPANAPISNSNNVTYAFLTSMVYSGSESAIIVERNNIVLDGVGLTLQSAGNAERALYLSNISNVTIKNTKIMGFSTGILLYSSSDNTISNNVLTSNQWFGISIQGASITTPSRDNIIANNAVTDSACGVQIHGGGEYYNTIENNRIYLNAVGIQLSENVQYSTFRGNTLSNNDYGFLIMERPEEEENYGNKIFHNSFVENTRQAVDNGTSNTWDDGYPSGGNYWNDYTDVDSYNDIGQNQSGSDGIWDHSYAVDTNDIDRYPLTGPSNRFDAGIWSNVAHSVHVVSNSTVSDFTFNADDKLISFNVIGTDGSLGFCRVSIPNALLGGPYLVLVDSAPPMILNQISDGSLTVLYFTYIHGFGFVTIVGATAVPEFSSFLILPLFMILILVVVFVSRRKHENPHSWALQRAYKGKGARG